MKCEITQKRKVLEGFKSERPNKLDQSICNSKELLFFLALGLL